MKTAGVVFTLFAVLVSSACGQTAEECSKSALSDAAVVQLKIYDKDLYLEPDCIDGTVPLPVHCNYMGLGQECRGCFMTCDGVARYMVDFADEIEAWALQQRMARLNRSTVQYNLTVRARPDQRRIYLNATRLQEGDAPIIHFCPDSNVADVDEC